jgi:hypothetical protein
MFSGSNLLINEHLYKFTEISGMTILVTIYFENTVISFYGMFGEWDILVT